MVEATVTVTDEAEVTNYSISEALDGGISANRLNVLASKQGQLETGCLKDTVQHNPEVVERARDEGCFVASISVSYWMRSNDDEIAETFDGNDRILALVENYSDDAWRIVGKQETTMRGRSSWFTWAWTFVPKSQSTVVQMKGVDSEEAAWELRDQINNDRFDDIKAERDLVEQQG